MRCLQVLAATCLLFAVPSWALAEEPPTATSTVPSRMNGDRLRWLQYTMVAGRIAITSDNVGTNMTYGPAQSASKRRERLLVQIHPAQIELRYELTAPDGLFSVSASSSNKGSSVVVGHQFVLKHAHDGTQLVFEQKPGEPLLLELESGGRKRGLRAPSFWHFYVAEPDAVRKHLIPALEVLHPSWQLAPTGAALEEALLARAARPEAADTGRWARLVDDLASPKFTERAAAERKLLGAGQVILPFLHSLDRRQLDAEQNARVRDLIETLAPGYQDSTERLAVWLAGDTQIWLALLARPEPAKRRIAARQLTALLGAPIDFDPEADQPARDAQWQRLRSRIVREEPAVAPSVPPPGAQR
jgi:hypothetical protein